MFETASAILLSRFGIFEKPKPFSPDKVDKLYSRVKSKILSKSLLLPF